MTSSSSVTNADLSALLQILYEASVRKNALAKTPVYTSRQLFFLKDDIPTLATTYGLPLPTASLDATLRVGLARGVYTRSIVAGTQCGASACTATLALPTLIYGYNPEMLRVNANNAALVNSTVQSYYKVHGSFVRYANNRFPCYGTRGYAVTRGAAPLGITNCCNTL